MTSLHVAPILILTTISWFAVANGFIIPIFLKTIDLNAIVSKPQEVQPRDREPWRWATPATPPFRSWLNPFANFFVPTKRPPALAPQGLQSKENIPIIVGQGYVY